MYFTTMYNADIGFYEAFANIFNKGLINSLYKQTTNRYRLPPSSPNIKLHVVLAIYFLNVLLRK